MRMIRVTLVAAGIAALGACGSSDTPTTPSAPKFATLTLTPATAAIAVGATTQLTATPLDAQGNALTGVTGTTFASSDQTKATVDGNGLVKGVAVGTATITASLTRDGVTGNATSAVTVGNASFPTSAAVVAGSTTNTFTPTPADIAKGGTVTFSFGTRTHNVTFDATAGAPANVPSTTGADVDRVFSTVGTFMYNCTIHSGMTGTVVVH